ncbi:MAG TPA: hypothetical protein VMR75_02305 [Candidatus Saccharimonadales bacterium]|jgi:hypothetical protein|nr:hypothetical protein [Candidatus Saccharimonadales bacterium]
MLGVEFLEWWYGRGYKALVLGIGARIRRIVSMFSLPLLIRTLGAPWRRIISYGGGSIGDRARAMLDNIISRFVGFCVRCIVILAACITVIVVAIGGGLLLILWPFLPLISFALVIRGLFPW